MCLFLFWWFHFDIHDHVISNLNVCLWMIESLEIKWVKDYKGGVIGYAFIAIIILRLLIFLLWLILLSKCFKLFVECILKNIFLLWIQYHLDICISYFLIYFLDIYTNVIIGNWWTMVTFQNFFMTYIFAYLWRDKWSINVVEN